MDEIYIHKVLNGDTDAFRYIIRNYKDMAYSLAMSVLKDEYVAQEVLQTSFIRAFSNLASFKGKSKFSTWLYRIVINEALKVLNKRGNNFLVYEEGSISIDSEIDDFTLKIGEDDQQYYINEALERLSPRESLCLRLFYLEENSIEEIAEITGWTRSNIKVILHRARTNAREMLKKYYNIDKQALYL
jgi:RNA polymerase sigma factor (sigma-70 family)